MNSSPNKWNSTRVPRRVAVRAYSKCEVQSDGCWISCYSTASHGYAQIGWQSKRGRFVVLAHRAAWTYIYGQVPIGMTIDHICKERRCVNPDHMRLLTNFENARRTHGKDWPVGTCINGHDPAEMQQVTRKSKSGLPRTGLACRECARIYRRRYVEKKRLKATEEASI